jgi:hypothetical protein
MMTHADVIEGAAICVRDPVGKYVYVDVHAYI